MRDWDLFWSKEHKPPRREVLTFTRKMVCESVHCGHRILPGAPVPQIQYRVRGIVLVMSVEFCPSCWGADSLVRACDHEDCWAVATCGTPTPDGYKVLCGRHYGEEEEADA